MSALQHFPPNRSEALARLARFVPKAGRAYASQRNHDFGAGKHTAVSTLSPYLRHRLVTEEEVLQAVLGRHSLQAAQKFIQEVFWRTYWKGWLEMRPSVWTAYQAGLMRQRDALATQAGLRDTWEAACLGRTGIACFDAWARELAETGYLHNHARMWFASIWIFTLRLPWELGADFFLRHLLDGDPASNTLSWRWVAGLQTRGKNYMARPSNIATYTDGRFCPAPGDLAADPAPLDGPEHPPRMAPPQDRPFDPTRRSVLVLHAEDLAPGYLFDRGLAPVATAIVTGTEGLTPFQVSPAVIDFKGAALEDAVARWSNRLGPVQTTLRDAQALADWARSLKAEQIVAPYAPVGPVAAMLDALEAGADVPVIRPLRAYDAEAWPHASAGFFKFKDKIPRLLGSMKGLRAA